MNCQVACGRKEPETEAKISEKQDIDQKQTIFPCISCNSIFLKREECREHMREHARNKTLKCRYCDGVQSNMKQLLQHLKMHRSESLGDANQLAMSKNTSKVIQKGKQNTISLVCAETNRGKKISYANSKKCRDCSEVFTNNRYLLNHMKLHNVGKLLYSCAYCNYRSDYPTAIKRHLTRKHKHWKMLYKCAVCNYITVAVPLIKTHVTTNQLLMIH